MIEEVLSSYTYWTVFFVSFALGCFVCGAKLFDYVFMSLLIICQYLAHSCVFWATARIDIFLFCFSFYVAFLFSYKFSWLSTKTIIFPSIAKISPLDGVIIVISKIYVVVFFSYKIYSTGFGLDALDLAKRLIEQKENRLLFFLGMGLLPAFVAIGYDWLKRGFKFNLGNIYLILVTVLGLIMSASKSAMLPVMLSFFFVLSYSGFKKISIIRILILLIFFAGVSFWLLSVMLPRMDYLNLLNLIAHRLVANTDSLEYIYVLDVEPSNFPYSGMGALFPFVSKLMGYEYLFPPGVWLHGLRYGVWDGYGPNSGMVNDFYGNISWFGLLFSIFLAKYIRFFKKQNSCIGCMAVSISYLLVIDYAMFQLAFIIWGIFIIPLVLLFYIPKNDSVRRV